jgi:hypothetical protein
MGSYLIVVKKNENTAIQIFSASLERLFEVL